MLTEYGKILRKLRIDKQELLKDMADCLDVSSAYLSAVETGKRRIPANWTERIIRLYRLDAHAAQEMKKAEDLSCFEVKINLDGASAKRRSAVLSFAKALEGMSDEQLEKIMTNMRAKGVDKNQT